MCVNMVIRLDNKVFFSHSYNLVGVYMVVMCVNKVR